MMGKNRSIFTEATLFIVVLLVIFLIGAKAAYPGEGSTWLESFYENGVKKSRVEMVNGKKSGMEVNWYPSGCIMSVHHFKQGVLSGPMIKWEDCEDIIAIGEYREGVPWNGWFLVNPSNAVPITDIRVRKSDLTYYVMKFTDGRSFTGLTSEMIEGFLKKRAEFRSLLEAVKPYKQ